jgi:hypothetical protein
MHRRIFLLGAMVLSAAGMVYSAKQLADPTPVKANDPVCCVSDRQCGGGSGSCGKSSCGGLNGGAC